ncbi:hypothetical protein WD277_11715 [Pseudomonas fragi]|uniref:hypothetical protein n=1 Tax=Pseudomonas fragi TaxID=296 RepID=UPI0030ADEBDE
MRKQGFFLLLLVVSALQGCGDKDLSPEQKAYVDKLNTELAATKLEIDSAQQSASAFSGGIINLLATTRLEILKTNQELLEQRILSVESGSPVKVETLISAPDDTMANALLAEIETSKSQVASARAEASQYSGGLMQVLKLSVVATNEQTLAMLKQRYLIAKYGLNPASLSVAPANLITVNAPATTDPLNSDRLPPADGPLGLAGGLSKNLIERMTGETLQLSNEAQSLYTMTRAPKANESFERYALVISPTVGLCQIRAIGKTISTNGYGHQLKSSFEEIENALTNIYGKPTKLDILMPGSIWKEPNDWMMGLRQNDRTFMVDWSGSKASPLKNDLESIVMEARALGSDKGYFMLQYSFSNEPQCVAEQKSKAEGSL